MRNSSPVALGQVIANKYQVEGVLGEGGMGVVVSAWHLGLEQRVAIKLLLHHMRQADSSALERFQREARAAARIRSEHVCRVIDTGNLDDGTPFLVMEYLEGADLADELLRRGRFEVAEAVRYIREACLALHQAHEAGVIHRDLKPANLFLVQRPDGTRMIKVLDFGVSKSLSGTGSPNLTLTKTSALVGSPIYMSPEQLNSSRDVDGRTDLWALGTILYELVAGRTPFYGETIPQLVNAVLNTEPEPFSSLNISVPAGLELVIRRALSKPRDGRYATAMELYEALGPYSSDRPGSISGTTERAVLPTRSMSLEHAAPVTPAVVSAPPPNAKKRRLPVAALVLLLIGAAGLAAFLSRRAPGEGSEPGPSPTGLADAATTPKTAVPRVPEPPARAEAVTAPAVVTEATAPGAPAAASPEPIVDAQPSEPARASNLDASEPRHSRDRSRTSKETAPPPAQPEPEPRSSPRPEPSEENVSNFGGRR